MNSFWKTVLAVIVGTLCVSIISCLFTTCVFVGMIASSSSSDKAVSTKEGDVMLLKINGPVTEIPASMSKVQEKVKKDIERYTGIIVENVFVKVSRVEPVVAKVEGR